MGNGKPPLYVKVMKPHPQYWIDGRWEMALPSVAAEQQRLFEPYLPPSVRLARVKFVNDDERVMVLEGVRGTSLKALLQIRSRPRGFDIDRCIRLTGNALAAWHRLGSRTIGLGDGLVRRYLDFAIWNILASDGGKSIILLDFPGVISEGAAALDLATFLHSLLVVGHHPILRVRGIEWWNWRGVFATFLEGYLEDGRGLPGYVNARAIVAALRETIRIEIEKYKARAWNPRYGLEGAWYFQMQNHEALAVEPVQEVVDSVLRSNLGQKAAASQRA